MDFLTPMFTPPQLAQRYGVKPSKILGWIKSGELQAINIATKVARRPRYRISHEAVAAFEEARSANRKPKPRRRRRDRERPRSDVI